jgi:hypothetical protein
MHYRGSQLELSEATSRVQQGEDLAGSIVPARAMVERLTAEAPQGAWTVLGAVLPAFDVEGLTFSSKLTFRDCTFAGRTAFSRCDFRGDVLFVGCEFAGALAMAESTFAAGLAIQDSTARGDLHFTHSRFEERVRIVSVDADGNVVMTGCTFAGPPSFENVRFLRDVELLEMQGLWDADLESRWTFGQCHFGRGFRLDVPAGSTMLSFDRCRVDHGGLMQVAWGSSPAKCTFGGSFLAGRVILRRKEGDRPRDADVEEDGAEIELSGATISGELDLLGLPLKWLDLKDACTLGGRIRVSRAALSHGLRGWDRLRPWRWDAADRCGVLHGEQEVCRAPQGVERPAVAGLQSTVDQYEELRSSFASLPGANREEDFCHYKCMDYRRRCRVARLGMEGRREVPLVRRWLGRFAAAPSPRSEEGYPAKVGRRHFLVTLAIVAFTLVALLDAILLPGRMYLFSLRNGFVALFWTGVAGLVVYPWWFRFRFLDVAWAVLDWAVFKWMAGYGIYVRRVVLSAIVLVLVFACIYWGCAACCPRAGDIVDSRGISILERPFRQFTATSGEVMQVAQPVPASVAFGRLVYFSGVTFTTLGYGDYHPVGCLKAVATTQAFLGALTIALVTVVFARRFIRR